MYEQGKTHTIIKLKLTQYTFNEKDYNLLKTKSSSNMNMGLSRRAQLLSSPAGPHPGALFGDSPHPYHFSLLKSLFVQPLSAKELS